MLSLANPSPERKSKSLKHNIIFFPCPNFRSVRVFPLNPILKHFKILDKDRNNHTLFLESHTVFPVETILRRLQLSLLLKVQLQCHTKSSTLSPLRTIHDDRVIGIYLSYSNPYPWRHSLACAVNRTMHVCVSIPTLATCKHVTTVHDVVRIHLFQRQPPP